MDDRDAPDLIDRLVAEYADRLARGDDPRRDELLGRAGELRGELERCLRVLEQLEEPPAPVAAGLRLGDFRLGRVLGRGGMAVIYEAEQESLGRRVALKVLRPHLGLDERSLERFVREARAAAKLGHEHVVPIHAVGVEDGHAYMALELVPAHADGSAPTLERTIELLRGLGRRPTAVDLARAARRPELAGAASYAEACCRLLRGVFAAVDHAHAEGVIHRDLKPSNVLVDAAGRPLVADFGLAKDVGEASLSLTGETLGTPHYMSPEQAQALEGRLDARTDVYSLGVILYELLTLRRPFEAPTVQKLMMSIVTDPPRFPAELVPDVPGRVVDVVLRALAKEREVRYASAGELERDLLRALRGEEVEAPPARGIVPMFAGYFDAALHGRPYEYRSGRTLFGLPWIHVVVGVRDPATGRPRWARGVMACGDFAVGVYAAGKLAVGFLSLGMISFGFVALGALAAGFEAVGGLVFGWGARGLMAAGHSGQGLLEGWFASSDAALKGSVPAGTGGAPPWALLVSLIGVVLAFTLVPAVWGRLCVSEEHRRLLRRLTRFWMPVAYAGPLGLHVAGVELPAMAWLLLLMATTFAFGTWFRYRVRAAEPGRRAEP